MGAVSGTTKLLYRLIFVSKAVGDTGQSAQSLAQILGASERNNRRDEIGAALMFHGDEILQVAEGARNDLDRLMTRLRDDRRHADIRILSDRPVERRQFPDWAMVRLDAPSATSTFLQEHLHAPDAGSRAEALLVQASRSMAVAP